MKTIRTGAAVFAALAVLAVASQATASHPELLQSFFADAGDDCAYGYTKGDLSFAAAHPPEVVDVSVAGLIEDNPLPPPGTICPAVIDNRHSVAEFLAHANDVVVDRAVQKVDDGIAEFAFTLSAPGTNIDLVTIQVCRVPNDADSGWPTICGEVRAYYPNGIGPA